MEICFSVDIGSESVKSAYAYKIGSLVKRDALLIGGTDFPSFAYCMTPAEADENTSALGEDMWKFGKEAIYKAAEDSNFRYLVRIGDLLSLFANPKTSQFYDKKSLYKNFYFPPKANVDTSYGAETDREQIAKKYFTAKFKDTPKTVLIKFLTAYCQKLIEEMEKILAADGVEAASIEYKWVLVYPSNAPIEYIKELMSLLKKATGSRVDPKLISVTKSVGAALLEYGLMKKPTQAGVAKETLIFNVGDEKTSVTNVHFRKDNIYTYRLKADKTGKDANNVCNEPLNVGGKNFDILINNILLEESEKIPSFGSGGDQSSERGSYAAQFMTMQDIKYGKALFGADEYYKTVQNSGIEFIYPREMKLHIPIKRERFLERAKKEVFEKIGEYVCEKLNLTCATNVDTVIFAGGGAETYGLEEYLKQYIKENFAKRKINYIDFSPPEKGAVCKPAYAAAIGAALFGIGEYEFTIVTTRAYATAQDKEGSDPKCKIIIPKGEYIRLKGKLYEGEEHITFTGFYPSAGTDGTNPRTRRYELPDAFYKLNCDKKKKETVEYNEKNIKLYAIVEEEVAAVFESSDVSLLKKLVADRNARDFNYDRNEFARPLVCDEGFKIDCEGRGEFYVENRTSVEEYKKIKIRIEGNMELD